MSEPVKVGVFAPLDLLSRGAPAASAYLAAVEQAGLDHVCCGDHVSFGGTGVDGLQQAHALTVLHPTLPVHTGVYLLPLRHPVLVARQLADIERLAPGRLVFGVGIGGEDRREVAMCGVDPATRGRRMEECLAVVRELRTGAGVSFRGEFFQLDQAVIRPAAPRLPIVVGGRSDAAIKRAGRLGDGWLGIWNSPRRFAEARGLVAAEAAGVQRPDRPTRHAMQVWCGLARTREAARATGRGHAGFLRCRVRELRAVLPVRHPAGRRRGPGTVRRGRLPRVQPDRGRGRPARGAGRSGRGQATARRHLSACLAHTRPPRHAPTKCQTQNDLP